MPTLGFLKKKRTREDKTDPSPPSNPTSPVTPTAARPFEGAVPLSQQISAASQQSSYSTTSTKRDFQPELADSSAAMNSLPVQQQPYPPQPTPSPGTEQPNLPRIANLIHPSHQHDNGGSYPQPQSGSGYPAPTSGGQGGSPMPPGTMPTHPQQHQQQQQLHPQQLQQMQQQQQQQPQHGGGGEAPGQAQAAQDQTRVTKGKYSLADFEILRTLGTGSFGRVHLVQSKHNSRFYAVKVLKKAQVVKMKQVEHTNDERRMLGEVKHPFLITLWGTFQDARNLYMVMDFVEGGELFSLLRKSGVCFVVRGGRSGRRS